jgi:hypothetical protein
VSNSDTHPFLDLGLDGLQQNIFRLLEIPPPSNLNLLKRRLRELSLQSPEILTLKYGLASEDAISQLKQWERMLNDPEALWIQEWFSPWGVQEADLHVYSVSDRAFAAEEQWLQDKTSLVFRHDLAVTKFCEAIDLELNQGRPETTRSEGRRGEVWERALKHWALFLDPSTQFWSLYDARIKERNDPRLDVFLSSRSRRAIILLPDWSLAALWARAQQLKLVERAERLISLRDSYRARMVEAGHVPGPEVWAEAIPELEARRSVLLSMIQASDSEFTEADLTKRVWPIRDLEDIARKYFQFVDRTLPKGQPIRYEMLKSLVESLRELLIRFGNQTGEWQATESFFELILQNAPSDELKLNLTKHLETISTIKLRQAHKSSFEKIEELSVELDTLSEVEPNDVAEILDPFFLDVKEEVFYLERPKISDLQRFSAVKDSASRSAIRLLRLAVLAGGANEEIYGYGAKAVRLAETPQAKSAAQAFLNEIKYSI